MPTDSSIPFGIDPEFQMGIPPITAEEHALLVTSLEEEGCREPLVLWREAQLLLDGHKRYALCMKHDIPFTTTDVSLPDRDAALDWIHTNQFKRRNLTKGQRALLAGSIYNRAKNRARQFQRQQREWIQAARRDFTPGEAWPCYICGHFQVLAHAHHAFPLSLQVKYGRQTPVHNYIWLCPTHHVAIHKAIHEYVFHRRRFVLKDDPPEYFSGFEDVMQCFFSLAYGPSVPCPWGA